MSERRVLSPSIRTAWGVLATVALAVVLVWLLARGDDVSGPAPGHAADDTHAGPLRVEDTADAGEVTLEGRGVANEPPAEADVRLRVVGRFGEVLPDHPVRVRRASGDEEERLSDARGEVLLEGVVLDGSVRVEAPPPERMQPRPEDPSLRLRHAEETLRVEAGTLLELDLRDAETGRRVEGVRWRYQQRFLRHTSPWHDGSEPTVLPFTPGGRVLLQLAVEPPDGWISWDTRRFWIPVDPAARVVRIVHPLRREARIVIDATETTDGSAASPVLLGFALPVRQTRWTWQPAGARGRIRARGIPFLRGAPFRVIVGDLASRPRTTTRPTTRRRTRRRPRSARGPRVCRASCSSRAAWARARPTRCSYARSYRPSPSARWGPSRVWGT